MNISNRRVAAVKRESDPPDVVDRIDHEIWVSIKDSTRGFGLEHAIESIDLIPCTDDQ